jgi:hypothetical protein
MKPNVSPAISLRSLPELEEIDLNQPKNVTDQKSKEEVDSISLRSRSKKMFL